MKNANNIYLAPEAEVILVETVDVITASDNSGNGGSSDVVGPWVDID